MNPSDPSTPAMPTTEPIAQPVAPVDPNPVAPTVPPTMPTDPTPTPTAPLPPTPAPTPEPTSQIPTITPPPVAPQNDAPTDPATTPLPSAPTPTDLANPNAAPVNAQAKKILIVEDETFIADLYSRQLTNAGYAVQAAHDGNSGLQLLESQPFDLLLLDIMLPGINGLELLKQFKTKNPQSTMQVLLLTNLGQDAVIKEGFDLGAQGYLIKASYTPAQIVNEVQNALSGKQAGSPNPNLTQPAA